MSIRSRVLKRLRAAMTLAAFWLIQASFPGTVFAHDTLRPSIENKTLSGLEERLRPTSGLEEERILINQSKERLLGQRDSLLAAGRIPNGIKDTEELAELIQDIFREVIAFYLRSQGQPHNHFAFALVGSSGRGQMNFRSDIDYIVVYDDHFKQEILPHLIDRLQVVFQKLGFEKLSPFAQGEIPYVIHWSRFSLLDRLALDDVRFVIGDKALFRKLQKAIRKEFGTLDRKAVTAAMLDLLFIYKRFEGHPGWETPRPNIKKGRGGVRDTQFLIQVAKIRYGIRGRSVLKLLRALSTKMEILEPDAEKLIEAFDFLYAFRNELHAIKSPGVTGDALDLLDDEAQAVLGSEKLLLYREHAQVIAGVVDRLKGKLWEEIRENKGEDWWTKFQAATDPQQLNPHRLLATDPDPYIQLALAWTSLEPDRLAEIFHSVLAVSDRQANVYWNILFALAHSHYSPLKVFSGLLTFTEDRGPAYKRIPLEVVRNPKVPSSLLKKFLNRPGLSGDFLEEVRQVLAAGEEIQIEELKPLAGRQTVGEVKKVTVKREGRENAGRAIIFDPQVAIVRQVVNPRVREATWDAESIRVLSKEQQPGLPLARLLENPAQWGEIVVPAGYKLVAAMNNFQFNFWERQGFLIVNGRLVKVPDVTWVKEPEVFVLDAQNPGLRQLELENGIPKPAGIQDAIVGPVLVRESRDVSGEIQQYSPDDADPNGVRWDPKTTAAAFSAVGRTENNHLIFLALAGQPDKGIPQATVSDVVRTMLKLGAVEAMLLGGSMDVQQWVAGEDEPEKSWILGRHNNYPHDTGRSLNAALFVYAPVSAAGLEEKEAVSKEMTMPYGMHILPSTLFLEQMRSFYRRMARLHIDVTISLKNERNNREATQPKTQTDVLSLGLQYGNKLTITVQGKVSRSVKEAVADAVMELLRKVKDAETEAGFDQQQGLDHARQNLSDRFGRKLARLEQMIREEQKGKTTLDQTTDNLEKENPAGLEEIQIEESRPLIEQNLIPPAPAQLEAIAAGLDEAL